MRKHIILSILSYYQRKRMMKHTIFIIALIFNSAGSSLHAADPEQYPDWTELPPLHDHNDPHPHFLSHNPTPYLTRSSSSLWALIHGDTTPSASSAFPSSQDYTTYTATTFRVRDKIKSLTCFLSADDKLVFILCCDEHIRRIHVFILPTGFGFF